MDPLYTICLNFDVEEFDLPREHGCKISDTDQLEVTQKGMIALLPMIGAHHIECTFFTTAQFAKKNSDLIKKLADKHEIASHSFYHSSFQTNHLLSSKQELEEITRKKVVGFRMPRMMPVNYPELRKAGYKYDSSLHPTWLPGRYNHIFKTKTITKNNGLIVFPASVTPFFRIPLFWLSFKNMNIETYIALTEKCLRHYGYANIYLHPWEFTDLSGFKLPSYVVKPPALMKHKLERFLTHFREKARFTTIERLLTERNEL